VKRLTVLEGKRAAGRRILQLQSLLYSAVREHSTKEMVQPNFVDAKKIPLRNQRFFTDIA
jgi:hypothetical protein